MVLTSLFTNYYSNKDYLNFVNYLSNVMPLQSITYLLEHYGFFLFNVITYENL